MENKASVIGWGEVRMTKDDVAAIIGMFKAGIPGIKLSDKDFERTVAMWHLVLANKDHNLIQAGAVAVLESHKYPNLPTVAAIIEAAEAIREATCELSADEAWNLVSYLLYYSVWRDAESGKFSCRLHMDAWGRLTERTRRTVRLLGGWDSLSKEETAESILRAHFKRTYDSVKDKDRTLSILPAQFRTAIEGVKRLELTEGKE